MIDATGPFLLKIGQIIWINVLLSGDNAVVIALACRGLPPPAARPESCWAQARPSGCVFCSR